VALGRLAAPDGSAVEGPGPRIAAVHPLPPWPAASQADWRRDVLGLRVLCRRGWLVGGDLNATIDHSPLRSVLAAGCTDAAAATGQGLRPTWSGGPLRAVRPAIDHVLTSGGWRPVASGVLAIRGSDHRAVWTRVVRRSGD
jgi:endonuclease/exonuclease/phosphatase (EEP) superfamily protein YafD